MKLKKSNGVRRLLSLILSCIMLVGLLPTTAFAAGIPAASVVSVNGHSFNTTTLYYKNGGDSTTSDSSEWNAYYDPTNGILELKNYDGGSIDIGGALTSDITIKLIGANKITTNSGEGIANTNGGDITITADSAATLEINVDSTDSAHGIRADTGGAYTSGSVTLQGYADVTANVKTTGSNKYAYGIKAYIKANVIDNASFKAICTGSGNGYGYGIYAAEGVIINTNGNIDIDVTGCTGPTSVGCIGATNINTLTKVCEGILKYPSGGGAIIPNTSQFNESTHAINEDAVNGVVSYRYGTPYTVTVENGTTDVYGLMSKTSAQFLEGDDVTVVARVISGIPFKKWTSGTSEVIFASDTSETTSFTMPGKNVTVAANYNLFTVAPGFAKTSNTQGVISFTLATTPDSTPKLVKADNDTVVGNMYFHGENLERSNTVTDGTGSYNVPNGDYRIAVEYGSTWFFSDVFTVNYGASTEITTGNATVTAPIGGQTPSYTAVSDDPSSYSVEFLRWIDVENNQDIYQTDLSDPSSDYYNFKFESGKQYVAVVEFTAVGENTLSYDNSFTINGETTGWTENVLKRIYKFTATSSHTIPTIANQEVPVGTDVFIPWPEGATSYQRFEGSTLVGSGDKSGYPTGMYIPAQSTATTKTYKFKVNFSGGWLDSNEFTVTWTNSAHTVTVTGGTASSSSATVGTEITLTPSAAPSGLVFDKWEVVSGGVTVTDNKFTMPDTNVEIKAVYKVSIANQEVPIGTDVFIPWPEDATDFQLYEGSTLVSSGNKSGYPDGMHIPEQSTATTKTYNFKVNFSDGWLYSNEFTVTWKDSVSTEYDITVTEGKATSGAGVEISKAAEGVTVTLTANAAPTGMIFDKWEVLIGSITLANANSATTTFIMPAGAVSVKATYKTAPATYSATVADINIMLPAGYGSSQIDGLGEQRAIKITNTGTEILYIGVPTLSGINADAFGIQSFGSGTIAAGNTNSTDYAVRPVEGLAPGTYTATISCTDTGGNLSVPVTATVTLTVDDHHFDTSTWESDATYHWNPCTDTGCTAHGNEASHDSSVIKNDVAATFDTDGNTGDKHCSVCDRKMETGTVIAAGKYIRESKATMVPASINADKCANDLVFTSLDPSKYTVAFHSVYDLTDDGLNTDSGKYPSSTKFVAGHQYGIVFKFTAVGSYVYDEMYDTHWSTFTLNGSATEIAPFTSLAGSPNRMVKLVAGSSGITTYTVSFNPNDGTGTMSDVIGVYGNYTLPTNGFTAPAGKQFKGWATSATGPVISGPTIDVTSNITLYAIWEDIPASPAATVANVTISGTTGTVITDSEIIITLTGDTFETTLTGNWITNLPAGLTQALTRNSDTEAKITVSGTPTAASTEQIAIAIPADQLVVSTNNLDVTANANAKFNISAPTYSVTINAGANMALTSGNANQSGLSGAMTDTVYTAADGYYFPTDYSVAAVNGISVTRNSYTQITVSGTPTANTTITLNPTSAKTKEDTPTATFDAQGADFGNLYGLSTGIKYSLDGGTTWTEHTSGYTYKAIYSVSADKDIKVYMPASGPTKLDSDVQTIDVTKSSMPIGIIGVACTTITNDDGKLQNVTTAMQYKKSDASGWTSCSGTEVTGLVNGTYYVRIKANGTVLESEYQTVTVAAYAAPVTYTVSFNANGGTVTPTSGITGIDGKLTSLPTPTRSGSYTFNGWYTAASGGTQVTTNTEFTEDSTIFAHWTYVGGSSGGKSSITYYTLTFDTNGGGSVSNIIKAKDTTIEIGKYKPEKEGFEFTGWYSDKGLTEKIASVKLSKNTTVYAGWKEIEEKPYSGELPFVDADTDDWFFEDVAYVNEKGLMNGTSATTFAPNMKATRGMIITILYRLENEPEVAGELTFNDVKPGSYYEKAVIWAAENNIVYGYGNNIFGHKDYVTREQLVTILWRYAKYKGYDVSIGEDTNILSYDDAQNISEHSIAAMQWACGEGIISGTSDTTLSPKDKATRAEIAAIIHRFCESLEKDN